MTFVVVMLMTDAIEAVYQQGVWTLTIPKVESTSREASRHLRPRSGFGSRPELLPLPHEQRE